MNAFVRHIASRFPRRHAGLAALILLSATALFSGCAGQQHQSDTSLQIDPVATAAGDEGTTYTNSIGMKFVFVKPGSFYMGSPEDEVGRNDNEHVHEIFIPRGFFLQTSEVTQGQWVEVMGNNPSHFLLCGPTCPVENVSWNDAQAFVDRLNQLEGTYMYRLPTEAEWEYACRAGTRTAFYTGENTEPHCCEDENLDIAGWYLGNANHGTRAAMQKAPNPWGFYDMHGNVWEWTSDRRAPYAFDSRVDAGSPESGISRIRRGGAFNSYPRYARSAYRGWLHQNDGSPTTGLRIVRDPHLKGPAAAEEVEEAAVDVAEQKRLLAEIFFDYDKADIRPSMQERLEKAAEAVKHEPGSVLVIGNACDLGTYPYNEDLSLARAEAVKEVLVDLGVAPNRISTEHYGETRPRYEQSQRELNRRVDILLVSPTQ